MSLNSGDGEVALEEARRRRRSRPRRSERPPIGAHLRELVVRVGLDEVLLEDVAAHEVVVVGKVVPQVEVAREDVGDVHALLRQRLGPGRAIGGAEERVLARGRRTAPSALRTGSFWPSRADAEVLGVRSLQLAEAEREVVASASSAAAAESSGALERRRPSRRARATRPSDATAHEAASPPTRHASPRMRRRLGYYRKSPASRNQASALTPPALSAMRVTAHARRMPRGVVPIVRGRVLARWRRVPRSAAVAAPSARPRATTSRRSGRRRSCRRSSTAPSTALLAADPALRRAAGRASRCSTSAHGEPPRLAQSRGDDADLSGERGEVRLPDGGVRAGRSRAAADRRRPRRRARRR